MYIGPVTKLMPTYYDKWHEGIGTLSVRGLDEPRIFERYQCDKCGRVADVIGKAEEEFYCDCQALISIELKREQ